MQVRIVRNRKQAASQANEDEILLCRAGPGSYAYTTSADLAEQVRAKTRCGMPWSEGDGTVIVLIIGKKPTDAQKCLREDKGA